MAPNLAEPHPSDEASGALLAGFGLVLVGALALTLRLSTSVITIMVLGIALVVGGGVALQRAHAARSRHSTWWGLLPPLLVLAVGLALIVRPLSSLRVLTPLLMALFLLDGLFLMVVALREREGAWVVELLTGAVNLVLGVLLALQWSSVSRGLAGTLTGLYLISRGVMFIATSAVRYAHLRRAQPPRRYRLR